MSIESLPNKQTNFRESEEVVGGHEIGIGTTTFYPKWYPGENKDQSTDKTRGDLALQMLRGASAKNFQVAVVDGGSSEDFKGKLRELDGVTVSSEEERGMSGSRRQVFREVVGKEGVKVVCWVEPEKVSIVEDCLPTAARLVLEGKADIVIPSRDEASFATYPTFQARFEQRANKLWNDIVKSKGLYPKEAPDLDMWIGPRFIRNDHDLMRLFQQKPISPEPPTSNLSKMYDFDLWAGAIFLPVIKAMKGKYRVESVPVPYKHPAAQTAQESSQDSPVFERKRALQFHEIIAATIHEIKSQN